MFDFYAGGNEGFFKVLSRDLTPSGERSFVLSLGVKVSSKSTSFSVLLIPTNILIMRELVFVNLYFICLFIEFPLRLSALRKRKQRPYCLSSLECHYETIPLLAKAECRITRETGRLE